MHSYSFQYTPGLEAPSSEYSIETDAGTLIFTFHLFMRVDETGPDGEPLEVCSCVSVIAVVLDCYGCGGTHPLGRDMAMRGVLLHWADIEDLMSEEGADRDERLAGAH